MCQTSTFIMSSSDELPWLPTEFISSQFFIQYSAQSFGQTIIKISAYTRMIWISIHLIFQYVTVEIPWYSWMPCLGNNILLMFCRLFIRQSRTSCRLYNKWITPLVNLCASSTKTNLCLIYSYATLGHKSWDLIPNMYLALASSISSRSLPLRKHVQTVW